MNGFDTIQFLLGRHGQNVSRTGTLIRPTSRRIGRWRGNTCWPITCFKRRAAAVSPPTKISSRGSTAINAYESLVDFPSKAAMGLRRGRGVHGHVAADLRIGDTCTGKGRFRACGTQRCAICSMVRNVSWKYYVPPFRPGSYGTDLERLRRHPRRSLQLGVAGQHLRRPRRTSLATSKRANCRPLRGSYPRHETPTIPAATARRVPRGSRRSSTPSERVRIGRAARSSSFGTTGAGSTITFRHRRSTIKGSVFAFRASSSRRTRDTDMSRIRSTSSRVF